MIGIIISIILLLFVVMIILFIQSNNRDDVKKGDQNKMQEQIKGKDGKILVVYFSAQNHTKKVANQIATNLGADIFEIVPEKRYTEADLDWTDDTSRVSKEHDDESLRDMKLVQHQVEDWDTYDTVLLGYPIWWAVAAWPVDAFIEANDFSGKTIIPFCTSVSSELGDSGALLAEKASTGTWLEGYRFSSNPSEAEMKTFLEQFA